MVSFGPLLKATIVASLASRAYPTKFDNQPVTDSTVTGACHAAANASNATGMALLPASNLQISQERLLTKSSIPGLLLGIKLCQTVAAAICKAGINAGIAGYYGFYRIGPTLQSLSFIPFRPWAGHALQVASRVGWVKKALVTVAPFAVPGLQQTMMITNGVVTAWQLLAATRMVGDRNKLCAVLRIVPGFPGRGRCALGGSWGPPIPQEPPRQGVARLLDLVKSETALSVLAVAVVGAAAWAWHEHAQRMTYDQAVCPSSIWSEDPRFNNVSGSSVGMTRSIRHPCCPVLIPK
jgi:hypothetical protein